RFGDRASLAHALLDSTESEFQEQLIRGEPPLGPGAPPCERVIAFGEAMIELCVDRRDLMAEVQSGPRWRRTNIYSGYRAHLAHRGTGTGQAVEAGLFDAGENRVELLRPLAGNTPVGRFLAARGPGLHHVAYQVADIDATLAALKASGMRLIDETPRTGIRNSRVAFVHPKSSGGVLTEIVQPAEGH